MPLVTYVSKMEVHLQADGGPLVYMGDIMRCRISSKSGDNPVNTFGGAEGKGGLSGFSDGPFESMINFDKAVPRLGEDFNLLDAMLNHRNVTVRGTVGTKRREYQGRCLSTEEEFDLTKASTNAVQIHCGESACFGIFPCAAAASR